MRKNNTALISVSYTHLLRTDLFSDDDGGYVDCVALDAALLEKLQAVAEFLREAEGWEWCLPSTTRTHGIQAVLYVALSLPHHYVGSRDPRLQ